MFHIEQNLLQKKQKMFAKEYRVVSDKGIAWCFLSHYTAISGLLWLSMVLHGVFVVLYVILILWSFYGKILIGLVSSFLAVVDRNSMVLFQQNVGLVLTGIFENFELHWFEVDAASFNWWYIFRHHLPRLHRNFR